MTTTLSALSLPFDEAIAYLAQKTNATSEHWTDVWQRANARAFTVAGAATEALVKDFRAEVAKALEQGTTLADFRKQFDSIVKKHGWKHTGTPGWRARIIYETNLSMAYSAGRYAQATAPETLAQYPYWQYVHSGSQHPRLDHLSWDGLVLRADDEWWSTHYPPNGWRCGCRVRVLSARDLARQGKSGPDQPPPVETRNWTNPKTGAVHQVPKGIDPSFDYNPGAAWKATPVSLPPNATLTPPPLVPPKPKPQKPKPKPAPPPPPKPKPRPKFERGTLPPLAGYAEEWRGAFSFADSELARVVAHAPAVQKLPRVQSHGAYYSTQLRGIHMKDYRPRTADGETTWRHEFGHHVDYTHRHHVNASSVSTAPVMEQVRGDLLAHVETAGPVQRALLAGLETEKTAQGRRDLIERALDDAEMSHVSYDDLLVLARGARVPEEKIADIAGALIARDGRALLRSLPDTADRLMLSDLFDALTRHRLGGAADYTGGHPPEYYAQRTRIDGGPYTEGHAVEVFANWFALRSGRPGWPALIQRMLGRLSDRFEELLRTY